MVYILCNILTQFAISCSGVEVNLMNIATVQVNSCCIKIGANNKHVM